MNLFHIRTLIVLLSASTTAVLAAVPRPNIVFVLADDLGYSDVGFNGQRFYETPNIDALARDGIILSDFYSGGPNCAPTRACINTGLPKFKKAAGKRPYIAAVIAAQNRAGRELPHVHTLYPGELPRIGGGDNHINAEGQITLGKITASAIEEFYQESSDSRPPKPGPTP